MLILQVANIRLNSPHTQQAMHSWQANSLAWLLATCSRLSMYFKVIIN